MQDQTKGLAQLGSNQTDYKYDKPSADILETFENSHPHRPYQIELVFPEMTSLCPKTGQPDFATITVQYTPNDRCVETKSFKLYMFAFRNCGSFMENIVNTILEDLVSVAHPKMMTVVGRFNARGGTMLNISATHEDGE